MGTETVDTLLFGLGRLLGLLLAVLGVWFLAHAAGEAAALLERGDDLTRLTRAVESNSHIERTLRSIGGTTPSLADTRPGTAGSTSGTGLAQTFAAFIGFALIGFPTIVGLWMTWQGCAMLLRGRGQICSTE